MAFRVYAADHPSGPRTLRAKLEAAKAAKAEQLTYAQDWPDFKERRGVIQGLAFAIAECEIAEKQHGD